MGANRLRFEPSQGLASVSVLSLDSVSYMLAQCRVGKPFGAGSGQLSPSLSKRLPTRQMIVRSRDRILENLESIYRESYDRARKEGQDTRMVDLENAYMRDQLMLEILLDIRDLFSVAPAAPNTGGSALEKLEALRRFTKFK
jgi:hypothetical protein